MSRALSRSLLVVVPAFLLASSAFAHDSWVNKGGFKNGAGEWCCGDFDCKSYTRTSSTASGWMVDGELVPFDEAMPIAPPDGMLTICRRPAGSPPSLFRLKPALSEPPP